jgi:Restriction endonuclease NotI
VKKSKGNISLLYKPENIIGEILGKKSVSGYNPVADQFLCPFTKSKCTKSPKDNIPYPVCSIWKGWKGELDPLENLICVCPKRFYAINFLKDVVHHCWPGTLPVNPQIATEVRMKGFGNIDFVITEVLSDGSVGQFLSVELQAVDISGSVRNVYEALVGGKPLSENPESNFNWGNVYKRYITQLISKGYHHHHWKTKIVAVIQDQFYQYIKKRADFMCSPDVKNHNVNIIFMTYAFDKDIERPGEYKLVLKTVEGTSHSSLQNAIMYKTPPNRDDFCRQINRSLARKMK